MYYCRFVMFLAAVLCAQLHAYGAQVVEIRGHYVLTNYAKGQSLANRNQQIDFVVALGENAWTICATNRQNAEWEVLTFDGTNTYYLMPFKSHFDLSKADRSSFGTPKSDTILFGTVNAGAHYNMPSMSYVEMFCPWMVYCLPPQDVSSNMPLPWSNYARILGAYGWRWNVTPSVDGRFIEAFKVVRDSSFDLNDQNELLRPTFEYPRTLEDFKRQQTALVFRKAIPDGSEEAVYTCKEWYKTNNLAIPAAVEFRRNMYTGKSNSTIQAVLILEADQIILKEDTIKVPALTEAAYVRDYRYTQRNESRMYPFAEYAQSGDWKLGNDQELLAQRDNYLKHGPKYKHYIFDALQFPGKTRLVLVWLLLLIMQVVAIAILVRTKIKTKKNQ
jgi:hypothetical protein